MQSKLCLLVKFFTFFFFRDGFPHADPFDTMGYRQRTTRMGSRLAHWELRAEGNTLLRENLFKAKSIMCHFRYSTHTRRIYIDGSSSSSIRALYTAVISYHKIPLLYQPNAPQTSEKCVVPEKRLVMRTRTAHSMKNKKKNDVFLKPAAA